MATTDYGSDFAVIDDCQDPEVIATGDLNVAFALARRILTPFDAWEEIGYTAPYDCFDITELLGQRWKFNDQSELDRLQVQCRAVMIQDPRVSSVKVQVTFIRGVLSVDVRADGANGPFSFVLSIDGVTAPALRLGI